MGDYFEDDDAAGRHRAEARSDADPAGRWAIVNRPGVVRCQGLGARRMARSETSGRIRTDTGGTLEGRDIGERGTSVDFVRLGYGTYRSLPTDIRVRGQRIRIEAYLVMLGEDRFTGAMSGTIRGSARCDVERAFDGRRRGDGRNDAGTPTDGTAEAGADPGTDPGMDDGAAPAPSSLPASGGTGEPATRGDRGAGADPIRQRLGHRRRRERRWRLPGGAGAGVIHAAGADPATDAPLADEVIVLRPGERLGISIVGHGEGLSLRLLDEG